MVRKILRTTDPRLRQASVPVKKVDKKLLTLLRDMEETLDAQNDPEGLGIAAPQVGVFQRLFVLKPPKNKLQVFINPKIIKLSEKTNDQKVKMENEKWKMEPTGLMEGCLSLPHYYGPVQRAQSVTIKYQVPQMSPRGGSTSGGEDSKWKMENREETFKGFLAHIIQHEIDHLNGIFFVDHLLRTGRKLYQMKNKEWFEVQLI